MNTVRLYDFETKTLTDIPASELAPGYINSQVQGIEGTVFVKASQAKSPTEFRQPPFTDPKVLAKFERFSKTFKDVCRKTPQEWADGFRYDTTPAREIAWWERTATAFEHFTLGKNLSLLHLRDYFELVCSCFNNGSRHALQTVSLTRLSRARARGVIAEIARTWGQRVS